MTKQQEYLLSLIKSRQSCMIDLHLLKLEYSIKYSRKGFNTVLNNLHAHIDFYCDSRYLFIKETVQAEAVQAEAVQAEETKRSRKDIKILVACECSAIVASRFYRLGYTVYSCDIQRGEDVNYRHIHFTSDVHTVLKHLNYDIDVLIAFPPCTFLSYVGNAWRNSPLYPNRKIDTQLAIDFFMNLYELDIPHICLENPRGYIQRVVNNHIAVKYWIEESTDKYNIESFHPFNFGDYYTKETYLHTKNLPSLVHSHDSIDKSECKSWCAVKNTKKDRSRTFKGIANSLVEQYDNYLVDHYELTEFNEMTYDNKMIVCDKWKEEQTK